MKNIETMDRMTRHANLLDQVKQIGWESLGGVTVDVLDQIKDGIVFLAPPLDTVPSPAGNAIYTIVQDLVERAPVPALILSIWPTEGNPQACTISDKILYCKEPIKQVPFERLLPYRFKKFFWGSGRPELIEYARKAALLCNLLHPKVIVVEDVPLFGYILKRNLKISAQIVLHQHIDAPLSYSTPWWNKIKKAYSGMVFVASKTIQEVIKRHGNLCNATVVYNGVDLSHYDPGEWLAKVQELRDQYAFSDKDTVLLYVGRIIPGKGVQELAEAFLWADLTDTVLVIVGNIEKTSRVDKEFILQIKSIVERSRGKIILTGRIPQSDLPAWYSLADMVVVPSINPEGLPKVITEALAMGKPVLASDRGGIFELVRPGENGWRLDHPEDVKAFAEKLSEILKDKASISNLGTNALANDRQLLGINASAKRFFDFVLNQPLESKEKL
jgi:glycosyltransferase involved in cell wall biosynthesis